MPLELVFWRASHGVVTEKCKALQELLVGRQVHSHKRTRLIINAWLKQPQEVFGLTIYASLHRQDNPI